MNSNLGRVKNYFGLTEANLSRNFLENTNKKTFVFEMSLSFMLACLGKVTKLSWKALNLDFKMLW